MTWFRDWSIRTKLIFLAAATGGVVLLLTCAGFAINDVRSIRVAKVNELNALAKVLGFNSSAVLTFGDAEAGQKLLASLRLQPSIEYAALINADGALLAEYARDGVRRATPRLAPGHHFTASGHLELAHVVVDDGEEVGLLYLRSNMRELREQFWQYAQITLIVAFCSTAAAVLLSLRLQSTISRPIIDLTAVAKRISTEGDYSIRVCHHARDELGTLHAAFNHMLEQIASSKAELEGAHGQLEKRVVERTAQLQAEIAEREKAEIALRLAKDVAESANRAKSEFLANMSHEIRTPLNAVLGFTDILRRGLADEPNERQELLDTIHSSGSHLLGLINDILDLSKIEAGQLEVETIACSPDQILREVLNTLRGRAEEKGLYLEHRWKGAPPHAVETDPHRLRQLLFNLVGNAVKFTRHGGVNVVVELARESASTRLVFQVIDTGVGIPAEKLEAIFEPFVQSDTSVTRQFGGTGLGLAISRRIVGALGGDIRVTSQIGVGSVFTATVAAGRVDSSRGATVTRGVFAPSPPPEEAQVADPAPLSEPSAPLNLPHCRVLVVDDGPTNRRLLRLVLERAGAQVTCVENGRQAVDAALAAEFDVILMDMQMPVLDGYAATRELRQRGVLGPIIALTAHAMRGDEEKCLAAGCDDYLTKPLDTSFLLRKLREIFAPSAPLWSPTQSASGIPAASGAWSTKAASDAATCERDANQLAPDPVTSAPIDGARAAGDAGGHDAGPPIHSTLPVEDADFREIVVEFLDLLEGRLAELTAARDRGDESEMTKVAHSIKGSAGAAGFAPLSEAARRFERALRAESPSETDAALRRVVTMAARLARPAASGNDALHRNAPARDDARALLEETALRTV